MKQLCPAVLIRVKAAERHVFSQLCGPESISAGGLVWCRGQRVLFSFPTPCFGLHLWECYQLWTPCRWSSWKLTQLGIWFPDFFLIRTACGVFWEQHTHARGITVTRVSSDLSTKTSLPGVTYQLPGSFLDVCVCVCVCVCVLLRTSFMPTFFP